MIPIIDSKKEEKASLDKSKVESIDDKTGEIKVSDNTKGAESKDEFVTENDISVHKAEMSAAVIPVKKAKKRLSSKQKP